jgi:hypothetical protein
MLELPQSQTVTSSLTVSRDRLGRDVHLPGTGADEEKASYKSIYKTPPDVKYPYKPEEALADIPGVSYALELFLASHMVQSEEYCHKSDEKK